MIKQFNNILDVAEWATNGVEHATLMIVCKDRIDAVNTLNVFSSKCTLNKVNLSFTDKNNNSWIITYPTERFQNQYPMVRLGGVIFTPHSIDDWNIPMFLLSRIRIPVGKFKESQIILLNNYCEDDKMTASYMKFGYVEERA